MTFKFKNQFLLVLALVIQTCFGSSLVLASPRCENIFIEKKIFAKVLSRVSNEKQFYGIQIKSQFIDPLRDWYQLPFSKKAMAFSKRTLLGTYHGIKNGGVFVFNFLIPSPVSLVGSTHKILNKQLFNPDYQLSSKDLKVINNPEKREAFELRKIYLQRYPLITSIRKASKVAKAAALSIFMGLSISQAHQMEKNTVSFHDYLNQSQQTNELKVQVLIDTFPLPHTSLRIGNKVYSFGVSHMSGLSLSEYVKLQTYYIKGAKANSVRAIDLHLSTEEVMSLRYQLELETAKRYKNKTGINDCATMIARFLEKNSSLKTPPIIDAFPTVMGAYLNLLKISGDSRVGETSMIIQDESFKKSHLVRNTWSAIMEAKVLTLLLPIAVGKRIHFEFTTDESQITFYDPLIAQKIETWREEVNQNISNKIASYSIADSARIEDFNTDQLKLILTDVVEPQMKEAKSILDSPAAEFEDIIVNQEKWSHLLAKQHQILEALNNIENF